VLRQTVEFRDASDQDKAEALLATRKAAQWHAPRPHQPLRPVDRRRSGAEVETDGRGSMLRRASAETEGRRRTTGRAGVLPDQTDKVELMTLGVRVEMEKEKERREKERRRLSEQESARGGGFLDPGFALDGEVYDGEGRLSTDIRGISQISQHRAASVPVEQQRELITHPARAQQAESYWESKARKGGFDFPESPPSPSRDPDEPDVEEGLRYSAVML
jgi:hypothetical protein